jgi:DNA-binding MarR family transcriptional regulator
MEEQAKRPNWTFITSHGVVLLEVMRSPDATVKQIAARAAVTERQAHRILADLVAEDYIVRERVGRRNRYRVNGARKLRHPAASDRRISELLSALQSK